MKPTPGQKAYEGYYAFTKGKTYDGKPMPLWLELGDTIREAWEQAAYAAIHEYRVQVTIKDHRRSNARAVAKEYDDWYLAQGKKYHGS